jgi:hypothetical protein
MSAIATVADVPIEGFTRLVESTRLRSSASRLAEAIERDGLGWERLDQGSDGIRRYAVDLRLRVGAEDGGFAMFRKAAFVDVGRPILGPDGWEAQIAWRASTAAPLFPVFAGTLRAHGARLSVDGLYAPPGGVVGKVADRLLLHVAANATARWLLVEVARAGIQPGA